MIPGSDALFCSDVYEAISQYIMDNAQVNYPTGTVLGTCPPSGALIGGSGAGGVIS